MTDVDTGTDRMLDGVRVLDLSRVMSGPFCTAMMADLGAEVIKIEMPGSGDDSRHFGPFVEDESAYFMLLNRGKKSVTLDLKSDRGRALERVGCRLRCRDREFPSRRRRAVGHAL